MGIQRFLAAGFAWRSPCPGSTFAAETIRIADIDAVGGASANAGESFLAHLRMDVDNVKRPRSPAPSRAA